MAPQVTLFVHGRAPNPPKVAIFLEELGVEYAVVSKEFGDGPQGVKNPEFLKMNPNGRIPAIIDHSNNNKIVWESGAILLYLGERFDKNGKFVGEDLNDKAVVWEWPFFQMSGLGPSQGQANWFLNMHPIKDLHPSVVERYQNESYRIYGVLEKRLKEEGDWLCLKRFTIADMAHYPWILVREFGKLDLSKFPKVLEYFERIQALPSVQKAYAKIAAAH